MKVNRCLTEFTASFYGASHNKETVIINKNFNVCEGSFKSLKKKSKDGCCTSFFKCLFFPCTKLIQWILGLCSSKRKKAASSSSEDPSSIPLKKSSKKEKSSKMSAMLAFFDNKEIEALKAAESPEQMIDFIVGKLTDPEQLFEHLMAYSATLEENIPIERYEETLYNAILLFDYRLNPLMKKLPGVAFARGIIESHALKTHSQTNNPLRALCRAVVRGEFNLYRGACGEYWDIIKEYAGDSGINLNQAESSRLDQFFNDNNSEQRFINAHKNFKAKVNDLQKQK